MIFCTLGVPSRFSEWCETLLAVLIAARSDTPALFVADSLDQLGRELLARNCLSAVLVARQPQLSLCRELISGGRPVMVTLDEPENALGALMADYRVPYAEAVRRVANSLASLVPIIKSEKALILSGSDAQSEVTVARAMDDHFELGLDEEAIQRAAQTCPLRSPPLAHDEPRHRGSVPGYEAVVRPDCAAAIAPLWKHIRGEPLQEIVWSPELFSLGDAPARPPTAPIDLTGSSRCLLFGPYIRLPEGPWSCSVLFGCSERSKGARVIADVFAGVPLNRVTFELGEPGVFEIEFSFVNSNPDLPVEVRLLSAEATFEGEILFGQVRMSPLKARRLTVA